MQNQYFKKIKNIENKIKDFENIEANLKYIEEFLNIAISDNNEEYFDQLLSETNDLLILSNKSRLENLMNESADPNKYFLKYTLELVEQKVRIGLK